VGGLILVSAFSSIKAVVLIVGRVLAWTFTERFPNSRRGPDGPGGELMEDELGR
jgi:hypothetical protein